MTPRSPDVDDLWELLLRAEAAHGARVAVRVGDASWSYAEFVDRTRGLAAALRDRHGVEPGDRIAILARNGVEFLSAYFAAPALGAVLVPWNTRLTATEHMAVWERAGCRLLLAEPRFGAIAEELGVPTAWPQAERLREFDAQPAGRRDAPAQLYFTSGTTGQPKGVVLTHGNVLAHAAMTIGELELAARDVWGHIAPMFHLADAWASFAITAVGGTHTFVPDFSARAALDAIAERGITVTNLVPTMLGSMVAEPSLPDLRSLRVLLSGGAPIAPEVVGRIVERFGCEYVQTYGMTETSPFLTMSLLDDELRALPASERLAWRAKTGRPVAGVELRILTENGQRVPPDERTVGEIQVRGETVTPGYWRDDAATRSAFTPDGFLRTGDLAILDDHGFVTIVDRKKDVILTGGETVYSTEVENRLYAHEDVLEAAVVGHPDPQWGERVVAFVTPKPGRTLDAADLRAFCRRALAGFKAPKEIHVVDALPRTGSGKLDKKRLRSPTVG